MHSTPKSDFTDTNTTRPLMTTKFTNPIKNSKFITTLSNNVRTTLLKDNINITRANNRPRTTLRTRICMKFTHSYHYPASLGSRATARAMKLVFLASCL